MSNNETINSCPNTLCKGQGIKKKVIKAYDKESNFHWLILDIDQDTKNLDILNTKYAIQCKKCLVITSSENTIENAMKIWNNYKPYINPCNPYLLYCKKLCFSCNQDTMRNDEVIMNCPKCGNQIILAINKE